jgi:hypothetical protein
VTFKGRDELAAAVDRHPAGGAFAAVLEALRLERARTAAKLAKLDAAMEAVETLNEVLE